MRTVRTHVEPSSLALLPGEKGIGVKELFYFFVAPGTV